ncbi:MAG TPA: Fe-S cluster assembly protein SufD [Gemmatimonadaceae bacterium]|nr:Fe-S cluster assembly protein SufD [Gemmatimonadaceae bacterium]
MTAAFVEHFALVAEEGPAWLASIRRRALERFREHGLPTPKNEDWHYTNPRPIAEAAFQPMRPAASGIVPEDLTGFLVGHPEWPRLVFVNGRYLPALSTPGLLGAGMRVMSLSTALREEPTLVERHFARLADVDHPSQAFTALNTALMNDGALLHVGPEQEGEVAPPVHLLFIADRAAGGGVCHPRVLMVLEPQARATVIEQFLAIGGDGYFTNAVSEAWLGDGATLHHYRLQREAPGAFHVGTAAVRQGRDSHYVSFSFATGARLSRTNIYTTLAGAGCGATLNGLYMLDGAQHCDHQTRIEHVEPNCYSREVYKGILDGTSHGVFNGKVYVHPEAQKTDGKQTNNTLLLSERAQIDTKPQLEIFADDVKCTHGATVGRIDELALFYMKSRGVPDREARRLLTYAFAAEVLETIPLEPLKDALEGLTLERFTGISSVSGANGQSAP